VSVNGAHALADILLHASVEGEAVAPPLDAADGECWLVGEGATGAFAGRERCLAGRQAGTWLFAEPRDGMRVFDRATGQSLLFVGEWRRAAAPLAPAGGELVDVESRAAIATVINLLRQTGILPAE
jgi:hypothetical protein